MLPNNGPKNNTDYLDIFDDFVISYLKFNIKRYGAEYERIEPIILPCIKQAKEIISKLENPLNDIEERTRLCQYALANIKMILSQNQKMNDVKDKIRSYGCVLIVGAGVSYASNAPLAARLVNLLNFCKATNFMDLSNDSNKCLCFKHHFKVLDEKFELNKSHMAIAKSFPKYTREIISLNWDSLLERALRSYKRKFNKINCEEDTPTINNLWKLHGDVENITEDNLPGHGGWVFPENGGYVFKSFVSFLKASFLSKEPYLILIAGYSRGEINIEKKIIEPIYDNYRRELIEISMKPEQLKNESIIVGPSDYVLPRILPQQ